MPGPTEQAAGSALPYVPARGGIPALRRAADCRGCPLYAQATQTVFGAGPARAGLSLEREYLFRSRIVRNSEAA